MLVPGVSLSNRNLNVAIAEIIRFLIMAYILSDTRMFFFKLLFSC
jgi:hypothetical protein